MENQSWKKKCSTAFLWQKSGCDRQQLDENFFSPFWVVSSMMISQTFGVVYYVVGGGQIWAMPAFFWNKIFILDEMTKRNALKFAIFSEYSVVNFSFVSPGNYLRKNKAA